MSERVRRSVRGLRRCWVLWAMVCLAIGLGFGPKGLVAEPTVPAHDLVHAQAGEVPLLVTAPHGGRQQPEGVPPRKAEGPPRDAYTYEVAVALAEALERRLGKRPYLVAARFDREYIDANRAPKEAYEDADAADEYEAYHGSIRAYVAEIGRKWPGRGVLLDLHGQASRPKTIFRGTRNGATVRDLVRRKGEAAVIGPASLFGRLAQAGYDVHPPIDVPLAKNAEQPEYRGGFTVHTYGSHEAGGIDALQLEVGRDLRGEGREKLVADLAEAVAGFWEEVVRK